MTAYSDSTIFTTLFCLRKNHRLMCLSPRCSATWSRGFAIQIIPMLFLFSRPRMDVRFRPTNFYSKGVLFSRLCSRVKCHCTNELLNTAATLSLRRLSTRCCMRFCTTCTQMSARLHSQMWCSFLSPQIFSVLTDSSLCVNRQFSTTSTLTMQLRFCLQVINILLTDWERPRWTS